MQLKVLKLKEEYYALQIKRFKQWNHATVTSFNGREIIIIVNFTIIISIIYYKQLLKIMVMS